MLIDKIDFYGHFSIKQLDIAGNVLDYYEDKNLIMDTARTNMAEIIGGMTTAGIPINQFRIGTSGHVSTNILDAQEVGETDATKTGGNQIFDTTKTGLFSEIETAAINYRIPFDAAAVGADVTVSGTGTRYEAGTAVGSAETSNTIQRVVAGATVTYTITIIPANGNAAVPTTPVPYTEAGLYAGTELFAMKTFPARVKESTTQFVVTWSIIF